MGRWEGSEGHTSVRLQKVTSQNTPAKRKVRDVSFASLAGEDWEVTSVETILNPKGERNVVE